MLGRPSSPHHAAKPGLWLALALLLATLPLAAPAGAAAYDVAVEDYSSYQPARTCVKKAKPGTRALARWIDRKYVGGRAVASVRSCGTGGTSEHKEGRAIDWMMNASKRTDKRQVGRFLAKIFAEDKAGNPHALARRMGIMYVIWDDKMYASYREFAPTKYKSSSCKKIKKCSPTLRHRDHVHISLNRKGAKAKTSWYAGD